METYRAFLVLVAITCGIISFSFSNEKIEDYIRTHNNVSYTVTSQSGMNGGAIGFGFISGMCFMAVAITFLRREENPQHKV